MRPAGKGFGVRATCGAIASQRLEVVTITSGCGTIGALRKTFGAAIQHELGQPVAPGADIHPCDIGARLSKPSAHLQSISRVDGLREHADATSSTKAVAEAKHGYLLIQR